MQEGTVRTDVQGGVPITTEELLQTIGELFIQTRILRRMLNNRIAEELDGALSQETDHAVKEREIQGSQDKERQEC